MLGRQQQINHSLVLVYTSFRQFHIHIQQLAILFKEGASPLYKLDVFDSDRQDNGYVYWMFSAKATEEALKREECTILSVYMFVSGDMTDCGPIKV